MGTTSSVLVNVDDSEAARYARGRVLRKAGFEVLDASSGEQTLWMVRSRRPDLVLLDVHLPDINGIEVCRRIKQLPDCASTVVIQISASATSGPQAAAALNSGADCYLTEPVDPEVLIATIHAMLRLRRAERLLAESNTALREANSRLDEVNQALQRSNQDLEAFAFVASHDLQEPLRNISLYAELLKRSLIGRLDADQQELLHFVVDGARRMSTLIGDVLTYSRAGQASSHSERVPIDQALDWALQNLAESIHETGAIIERGPLPTVFGDASQLGQLFQNLIGNALKYRSPGVQPYIRVASEARSSDEWTIIVRDNGVGISPQYHERIFGTFKRLHGQEIPGTGIGLALCRRIVESHGGRIWVESEEGHGATFLFTVPLL